MIEKDALKLALELISAVESPHDRVKYWAIRKLKEVGAVQWSSMSAATQIRTWLADSSDDREMFGRELCSGDAAWCEYVVDDYRRWMDRNLFSFAKLMAIHEELRVRLSQSNQTGRSQLEEFERLDEELKGQQQAELEKEARVTPECKFFVSMSSEQPEKLASWLLYQCSGNQIDALASNEADKAEVWSPDFEGNSFPELSALLQEKRYDLVSFCVALGRDGFLSFCSSFRLAMEAHENILESELKAKADALLAEKKEEERIRNNQQKSQRSEDEKLELLQWEDSWENLGSWLDAHSVRDLIPFLIQNVTDEERADLLEECKTIPLWVEGQEIKKEVDSTVVMNEDAWVQFLDGFGAANVMGALTLSLSNRRFNEFVSLLSSSRAEEDE